MEGNQGDPTLASSSGMPASISFRSKNNNRCLLCRGGRRLCGKALCPIELKAKAYIKNLGESIKKEFVGSSPPSVFVGRYGYPHVFAGPMVPPFSGDTEVLDTPEDWIIKDVPTIVNYRYSLIRGNLKLPIDSARKGGRIIDALQELAMGVSSAETAIELSKPPREKLSFDDNSQPFGPSAPLSKFDVASVRVDKKIENAYYDRDWRASEAIFSLYREGIPISRLQKAFSMGIFGIQNNRKLVPTRWSITAVDSLLSQKLIDRIKDYPVIDEFQVFLRCHQHNTFAAILMPKNWSFEWMEAWFPGTFWNAGGSSASIEGDSEGWDGRNSYPKIGGCYFSTRLGVVEYLDKIKRQATALVVREIMPEFPLPLGVWFVRENIRAMFSGRRMLFDDLRSSLQSLKKYLAVPISLWIERSDLLKTCFLQRQMDEYLRRSEFID
uniref:DNA repair protein n=1 Tax=Candidatus Methanomethylicus mesodigestus TaxID=1867258 RepID=A0A7C3IXD8_9CREN